MAVSPDVLPDALNTPDRILAAADDRFAQHGYVGARLVDITADVGMTTGALYRYFPGKEDLPVALVARLDEQLTSTVRHAVDRRAAIRAVVDGLDAHQGAVRLLFERTTWIGPTAIPDPIESAAKELSKHLDVDLAPRKARELASFVAELLFHYSRASHGGGLDPHGPADVAHVVSELIEGGLYGGSTGLQEPSDPPEELRFTPYIRWQPSTDKVLPRSPKGIRTRQAIQEAAIRVFNQRGLADASIADIAAEAGVASGSVYRYFVDKADVLRSMQAEVEEAIIRESHLPLDHGRLSIREQLLAYLDCYERHLGLLRAWRELSIPGSDMADAWNGMRSQFIRRVVRVLTSEQAGTGIRDDLDVELVAQLHSMAYESTAYARFIKNIRRSSPSQLADTMSRLFIGGFGSGSASR